MSLQSNLKNIKTSFQRDEKMLESAFTLEILWRRYRKYIIAIIFCIFAGIVWWFVNAYVESQRAKEATQAYAKLVLDSTDKEALKTLQKSSPNLYDLYRYFNAYGEVAIYEELKDSPNAFVRSLAQYELASLGQNIQSLEHIKPMSLKNLAILQEAYLLFNAKDITQAHQKLMLIPQNAPFYEEALNLKHFGLKPKTSKDKS